MKTRALLLALLAAAIVPAIAGGAEDPVPETTIIAGPSDPLASGSAMFTFTSSLADSEFGCALDKQAFRSCSSPKSYSGLPDGLHTFFVFAVHDGATDPTPASWTWAVDTTSPPPVAISKKTVSYGRFALTWSRSEDMDHVIVLRTVRAKQAASKQVYAGPGTTYTETKFLNAQYHGYRITSYDKAGNASRPVDVVVAASALMLAPADGARIHSAPVLRWRAVAKATYYNAQLWINGTKILSIWPKSPTLKLSRTWTYKGHQYRLKPGRYTWFVWPGFGPQQKGLYGQPVGQASFVFS